MHPLADFVGGVDPADLTQLPYVVRLVLSLAPSLLWGQGGKALLVRLLQVIFFEVLALLKIGGVLLPCGLKRSR